MLNQCVYCVKRLYIIYCVSAKCLYYQCEFLFGNFNSNEFNMSTFTMSITINSAFENFQNEGSYCITFLL